MRYVGLVLAAIGFPFALLSVLPLLLTRGAAVFGAEVSTHLLPQGALVWLGGSSGSVVLAVGLLVAVLGCLDKPSEAC